MSDCPVRSAAHTAIHMFLFRAESAAIIAIVFIHKNVFQTQSEFILSSHIRMGDGVQMVVRGDGRVPVRSMSLSRGYQPARVLLAALCAVSALHSWRGPQLAWTAASPVDSAMPLTFSKPPHFTTEPQPSRILAVRETLPPA